MWEEICGKNTFIQRYQRFSIEWNQAVNVRSVKGKTFKETANYLWYFTING